MIKKILPALVICCTAVTFAQPIVTSANFPAASHAETYTIAEANSLTPGNSGANQVWDFSSVTLEQMFPGQIAEDILPVSGTPAEASFPQANYCIRGTSMEGNTYHEYATITASAMTVLGNIFIHGFPHAEFLSIYPEPLDVLPFPFAYNDTFVLANGSQLTYDGYGTLVLPFKTYDNAIRQKLVTAEPNSETYYYWYNADPYYEIMSGNFDAFATTGENNNIRVLKNMTFLGVVQNDKEMFTVYPNPTTGNLYVAAASIPDGATAKVFDLTGKYILEKAFSNNMPSNTIDVSALGNGVYLLKIVDNQQQTLHSQKLIKQ